MTYLEFLASVEIDNNSQTNKHHIIPRSQGGDDSKENLIMLTPAQHAFAHILYDRENGTRTAKFFLSRLGLDKSIDEITYEDCLLYTDLEAARTEAAREAIDAFFQDEEKASVRNKKISETKKGKPSPKKGKPGHPHTDEEKKKISNSLKGHPGAFTGKHHSRESKEKNRQTNKNYIWITDSISNQKIHKDEPIPAGWVRGRTHDWR